MGFFGPGFGFKLFPGSGRIRAYILGFGPELVYKFAVDRLWRIWNSLKMDLALFVADSHHSSITSVERLQKQHTGTASKFPKCALSFTRLPL